MKPTKNTEQNLLARVRMPKRITTEAQRARRRGTTFASAPLCFKRLDKNVALLGFLSGKLADATALSPCRLRLS